MRIGLAELETFLAVVEMGSFSLAAQKMHVSQPSVTARIQRLEDTLRTKLLTRTTRKLEATAAGTRLHSVASTMLQDLRSLIREFEMAADGERLKVVVAATPMVAAVLLPKIIRGYSERYTDVQIKLRDLQYEEIVASLDAGTSDMAVVAFESTLDKFRFQPLAEVEMLVVVPANHPLSAYTSVTLDQLAPYSLMMLERYAALRDKIIDEYKKRGLSVGSLGEAINLSTLLGMVDAGNGITILPGCMAQISAGSQRSTLSITDVNLTRHYGILLSKKSCLSTATLSFCRHLQEEFPVMLGSLDASIAR
jgi:DNA-binding transcriptional LysR family regulator